MSGALLGDWGEAIAAGHLEARGWTLLARKFRLGRSEIDLVARRGEVVAFVEVKTRSGCGMGHPLEAITPRKRSRIASVAESWIERFGSEKLVYRFDAVAVIRGAGGVPFIEHLQDAWGI